MIYLDNSATTKPCREAVEAVMDAMTKNWSNPSSLYHFGMEGAKLMRSARSKVAAARKQGRRGKHIITTAVEHHAILNCMKELEAQGFEVTYLQPDKTGYVSLESLKAALRKDTILVSVMMVNNESGAVMPIAQMAKLTHRLSPEAIFHTDAVQGFLKVPFQAKTLGADLISISSHKVHGPKGAGALYISPRLASFPARAIGGGQEGGFRSGTEGTPAIFGFAAACEAGKATFKEDTARESALLAGLAEKLCKLDGVVVNGAHQAPHILNIAIPGIPTQNTINILQDAGICVSAGSACAKGHRSHVMTAMGLAPEIIDGSFRVSICKDTTQEELDKLVEVVKQDILTRTR